jgi:hypothetical protein
MASLRRLASSAWGRVRHRTGDAGGSAGPGAPGRERLCRCGHVPEAHEHYRAGSDCSLCDCPRYRG